MKLVSTLPRRTMSHGPVVLRSILLRGKEKETKGELQQKACMW